MPLIITGSNLHSNRSKILKITRSRWQVGQEYLCPGVHVCTHVCTHAHTKNGQPKNIMPPVQSTGWAICHHCFTSVISIFTSKYITLFHDDNTHTHTHTRTPGHTPAHTHTRLTALFPGEPVPEK